MRPSSEESTVSQMKRMFGIVLVAGLVATSAIASNKDDKAADEIQSRLAPVGSVCMSGDSCAAAPAAPASAGPKSGKEVFEGFCTTCHSAGVMGAPKMGSASDWAPRAAKGLDTLYTHALSGFNAMPAKGMCAACSDDEIKSAVKYMVDGSK
jgi:cytochrome c5